jgi:hypothetical protein
MAARLDVEGLDRQGREGTVSGGRGARVVVPTAATAVLTSAIAVVINFATEWKTNPWAWLGVVGLTVVSAAVSLWLAYRGSQGSEREGGQVVSGSTAGRDIIQIRSGREGADRP